MKLTFTLAIILFAFNSWAQTPEHYCKAEFTPEQIERLREVQANLMEFGPASLGPAAERMIPIFVHIVGTDDGNGYYRLDHLFPQICRLNEAFDTTDFYFYLAGIDYIDNSDYYDHTFTVGRSMFRDHNIDDVANVYFVDNPADNCGYYSGWGDAVAIKKSCATPEASTWPHEFGHYFSLPHTFDGYDPGNPSTWERVDGTGCGWKADGFCDTPPDYIPNRWTCPSPLYTDPVGDTFRVDGSYWMSYANDACQSRFSPMQRAAMVSNLTSWRTDLLSGTPPAKVSLSKVVTNLPPDGSTDVHLNYEVFSWDEAPSATKYHIMISRLTSFSTTVVDTLVSDTAVAIEYKFTPGEKYYWKVKPIHPTNTCTEYSNTSIFHADGGFTLIEEKGSLSQGLKVFPNPVEAGNGIQVEFTSSSSGNVALEVMDLKGSLIILKNINIQAGQNRIELSDLELNAGMYLLRIKGEGTGSPVTKFVVER